MVTWSVILVPRTKSPTNQAKRKTPLTDLRDIVPPRALSVGAIASAKAVARCTLGQVELGRLARLAVTCAGHHECAAFGSVFYAKASN